MANDKNHVYKIDLDVSATASSKKAFNELQKSFEEGKHSAKELNLAYIRMSSVLKDTTELDKQYNKIVNDRIKDREKEIDKLKAMQIGIVNNTKLSEAQRKNLLETTRKRIDLVQQEIDSLNRANMVRIKQAAKEAQLKAEELKRLKEEEAKRKAAEFSNEWAQHFPDAKTEIVKVYSRNEEGWEFHRTKEEVYPWEDWDYGDYLDDLRWSEADYRYDEMHEK